MATPRRLLVDPSTSGVFHCVSRCVRRAFLCGSDPYSGRDYGHRRGWIRDRLEELAGLFAIEVQAYAVMSNHLHVVVRTLPGRAGGWGDVEVARRWLRLYPGPGGEPGSEPAEEAVREFCRDAGRLAVCRERLADLSWFMRCLNEPVARRANGEDGCTGRFWEGRFKCQRLEDAGAALACMAYVDLNPVRAGMAATPEVSDFTSAQDRAAALRARRELARAPQEPSPAQAGAIARAREGAARDRWLAPIGPPPEVSGTSQGGGAAPPGSSQDPPPLLAHLDPEDYLELLDWTGRQIRAGGGGRIAPHLRPALERLELDVDAWAENVARYGGLFHRLAAKLGRLREFAAATGRAWVAGHGGARQLYGASG